MNNRRLTMDAMLISINVVLSILTPIKLANFKFTFEAFPILVAGLLLGPTDGFIVGTIGSGIYQILFSGYGLMLTTPLWILPHAVSGIIVGLYAKSKQYKLDNREVIFITILSSLIVTVLNTVAIYVDAKIFGYYSFTYVFGSIIYKVIAGILLSIIYTLVITRLLLVLRNIIK